MQPGAVVLRVALLPGDGIGPEVVAEAVRVLGAIESRVGGVAFSFEEFSAGAGEYLKSGDPLPEPVFERLREFDAILLGAMGLPAVRWPSGVEMTPQLDLRERLDLYCGLRPVYLYHPADSPLKDRPAGSIDFLIVRESTEGLFSSRLQTPDPAADFAQDRMLITRAGAERVIRAAFRQSLLRRKHLTLIDKANVLPSMAFFRKVFDRIAPEFPEVETERTYIDAAALYFVGRPERFDVVVTENMFGDILSDLAAGLVGGMGMAPSADVGDRYAVFQPAHGSAPDIAGQGIANPAAAILSAAMMLDWLDRPETLQGAAMIRAAVRTVFSGRGARTRDMGGSLSTSEMTASILAALPSGPGTGGAA
jgi:3-isopropylmalate dehydrogenase